MAERGHRSRTSLPAKRRTAQADHIMGQLRDAGFPYVVAEAAARGRSEKTRVADVVAWAGDIDGDLRPYAAVEVKDRADEAAIEGALAQLAYVRDSFDTQAHYVVAGGQWYEADSGLREAHPLAAPPLPPPFEARQITDVDAVMSLLSAQMWANADAARDLLVPGRTEDRMLRALLASVSADESVAGFTIPVGRLRLAVPAQVAWSAVRQITRSLLGRGDAVRAEHTSRTELAPVMANLLGPRLSGDIFDPFMGVGSSLWAAGEQATAGSGDVSHAHVSLAGAEINQEVFELARRLGALSPYAIEIQLRDSFRQRLDAVADYVISEPPAGLRLMEPYRIDGLSDTRDGDLAAIDVAVRALRPAGRAVLHLTLGWTARSGLVERYRARLLDTAEVVALIGLPQGVYAATAVPSVLLVIDRKAPTGKTFVAQLGEDWADQLGAGGAALREFYAWSEDRGR